MKANILEKLRNKKNIKNKVSEPYNNKVKEKDKKRKLYSRLGLELFAMSLLPIIAIGVITCIMTYKSFTSNAKSQIEKDLYTAGVAVLASFEQNAGDYFYGDTGLLWKGGYNISKSEQLLGSINKRANIDVTIFSKDSIVITTAKNKKTQKNKKIEISDSVINEVFKGGYEAFGDKLYIDGKEQFMYAIPMLQEDKSEVVAMIVVSSDKVKSIASTQGTIKIVIIIIVSIILIISIFIVLFSRGITNSLNSGFKALELLSHGNLKVDKSMLKLNRKDEIGDMSRSIYTLSQEFRKIIMNNINMTADIESTANDLNITAQNTRKSVDIVDVAMDTMSTTAKKQANIVENVNEDMNILGNMIKNTYGEIKTISDYNIGMQKSGNIANNIVGELTYIRESLNDIIEVINKQTTDTYDLTKEIRKYAEMIASFADETNLLALNATIEAARVGEQGKGFAIVASQIQSLADQSNVVSNDISKTINLLVSDSKKSLETMSQVNSVIERLNNNIDNTKEIFNVVNDGIVYSLNGLKKIENQAAVMDSSRSSMMEVIKDLDKVAKQNIKCAADTEEVTKHIGQLYDEVSNIKTVTEKLVDSINLFEV